MANSDLWLIFVRTLVKRGPKTVRLKKTKGHALELKGFLEKYPELRTEARHNDIADSIAKAARFVFHHPELVKLSKALVSRHNRYVMFIRALFSVIGRVHLASQNIRKSTAFQLEHHEQGLPPTIVFTPLWNLADLRYLPLAFKCTSSMLSHHLQQHTDLMHGFVKLLTHCRFAASPTTSG